jgi:trimethylamine--corrinoid protein Co-methyltransferase
MNAIEILNKVPATLPRKLRLSILSAEDLQQTHLTALDVLEQIGVVITHSGVRQKMKAAGCEKGEGQALQIPRHLVDQALTSCPASVTLHSRDGEPRALLSADSYCLLAALHVVNLVDDETGDRRPITYDDACRYAGLMNQLDHLEVVGAWTINDKPKQIADRFAAHAVISNTDKPFYLAPLSMAGLEDVYQMCAAAAGGTENMAEKPFWITSATGIPPLKFPDFSLDRLIFAATRNLPVVVAPVEMAGASSPIDLFGTLVLLVANNLAGITIGQTYRPGAPMVIGGVGSTMDIRTGLMNYAGPEFNLLCGALAQMGRYYNLPVWGTGGSSSAKFFDAQSAAEMTTSLIFAILSGGHLIHDVAFLDNGLSTSYQTLVFCNEIASLMRHFVKGIDSGSADAVLSQIKRVGVEGNYMTSPETMAGFRDLWDSALMERRDYENWDRDGRLTLNHRLGRRVEELLAKSRPSPPDPARQKLVDDILNNCTIGPTDS